MFLKNFGLNYSKAFDPDIKISHAKLKHFDLSTLPLNKLSALSEIITFSKIIEEKVLLANQDKNSYGFLTGVDEKYNSVLERLEKTGEKFPQITDLWKKYLQLKKDNYLDVLNKAEYFINNCDALLEKDMSPKTIAILYLFFNNNLNVG